MTQRIDVPGMGLVEFPDGMSDADMGAAIKRSMSAGAGAGRGFVNPPATPPEKPAPGYGDVAINAGNKGVAGVIDTVLNAPTNVWNLGKAAVGAVATAAGRPDLAPDLTPNPDYARNLLTKTGYIKPESEPQTTGQRLLDMGVQGAVGGAINPAASGRQLLSSGLMGGATGLAAQGTKEATGSDLAANLVAIGAPAAAMGAANAARAKIADLQAQQSRNAPRDNALAAALDAGYQVPPSTVKPSAGNRLLESIAGKIATQQATSTNNVEVTDALARKAIGLAPDVPLTPQATKQVRAEAYQQGYAPLEQAGPVSTGRLYRNALDDIASKYEGASRSFPQAVRADVTEMVDKLRVRRFDAGDGLKMSQALRDDASKSFANGDSALGNAQRAAAKAIEDQIERGLANQGPELVNNFRSARELMAKSHTVEDAITAGTGHIDPRKIAAELQGGGHLTDELKTVGEFAKNFPKANQTPQTVGSPGVSKLAAVASGGLGLGGASVGGPVGAAVGAVAPFVVPPAAQSLILSKRYQAGLIPKYDPGTLAMALGQMPQLSTGAVLPQALIADQLKR